MPMIFLTVLLLKFYCYYFDMVTYVTAGWQARNIWPGCQGGARGETSHRNAEE